MEVDCSYWALGYRLCALCYGLDKQRVDVRSTFNVQRSTFDVQRSALLKSGVGKMKIEKFEDIQAWQEARLLTNLIYEAVRTSKEFDKDLRFKGQITAAGVSTMSNTAEGFDSQSNAEFIKFLIYSRRSFRSTILLVCSFRPKIYRCGEIVGHRTQNIER